MEILVVNKMKAKKIITLTFKIEVNFELVICHPQVILTPWLETCNLLEYVTLHL